MIGIVKMVSQATGMPSDSCRRIAHTAHKRYKIFSIPKKNGRGSRIVAQPAREVKAIQRALIKILSEKLPVHHAATAYQSGCSISTNASIHKESNYLSKFDFKDFFPSISANCISAIVRTNFNEISEAEVKFIVNACTWNYWGKQALCLGAPSSPFLSNAVMFDFDEKVFSYCKAIGICYSRYSDDIAISSIEPNILTLAENYIRSLVSKMHLPKLTLNDEKRVAVSRRCALRVTGLTLSNDGNVTVGRKRKRGVRAGVDKYIRGLLSEIEIQKLKGELAFVLSVEPSFRSVLLSTYGPQALGVVPPAG